MYPYKPIATLSLGAAYFLSLQSEKSVGNFLFNFATTFLFQSFLYAIWKVLLYPKVFSPLLGLPEPSGNSFWNGQYAEISAKPTGVPQTGWVNSVKHNGIIRYLGFCNQERLLIVGPKALSEVMVTKNYDFHKPEHIQYTLGRILGVGVLLAEGDDHKFQRRNLMPAFSFRHIKDLYSVFWGKGREGLLAMTEQIQKDAAANSPDPENPGEKKAELEVGSWASRMTLDIIGVAGMGRDFGAIQDPSNPLSLVYQQIFKPSRQTQILGLLLLFLPGWVVGALPVKRNNTMQNASHKIRAVCSELIKEKQEKLSRKALTDIDILSVALESGAFSEEKLVDQMMTFLAAGHETTASAMTWAIYLLCLHPEIQTKLRQEIRTHLPSLDDPSATVGALEIDKLPYLNAVVNEVLRYYSPVPITIRDTSRDTTIQGVKVPKGTRIIICPWATNKDMSLWGQDADKFIPERWMATGESPEKDKLAGNGGAESNYAFMTFIHGPRSCIGMAFAKAEFACLLATWIGRLEFELKNKEEMDEKNMLIKGGITARPSKGLHVYAKVVDGW
ncbi:cytochrome P450 4A12A [Zalerion maritima]|uniref:Cytochrome P450 4A12A n=1 Tax=Zalerion maritima TaxID=339359 RepID=A0AAD5RNT4_9PEZI|nr:cytochrome P450 4A12A [Zalerion maritima]